MNGISNEIYTLTNEPQVRPSTNIVISKNQAKDYLENTESPLENLITKNYQIFPNSSRYTGYIYDATLGDFMDLQDVYNAQKELETLKELLFMKYIAL